MTDSDSGSQMLEMLRMKLTRPHPPPALPTSEPGLPLRTGVAAVAEAAAAAAAAAGAGAASTTEGLCSAENSAQGGISVGMGTMGMAVAAAGWRSGDDNGPGRSGSGEVGGGGVGHGSVGHGGHGTRTRSMVGQGQGFDAGCLQRRKAKLAEMLSCQQVRV